MTATLLLADDSTTIQRVVQLTFADEDVRVIAAADGEAARQRIDAEPPDIVLADVGMPKLDGYEVSAYIKRTPALEHIPVLLLAGAFEPIDEERARASGCDGILVKPIEPQQLIGRVRELLAGHRRAPRLRDVSTADATPLAATPSAVAPAALATPVPPPAPGVPPAPLPDLDAIAREFVADPTPVARVPPPSIAAPPSPEPAAPPSVAPVPPADAAPAAVDDSDWDFHRELDELDANFSEVANVGGLDDETVSDFARDLNMFRGEPAAAGRAYAWDLPAPPTPPEETSPGLKGEAAAHDTIYDTSETIELAPLLPEVVAPPPPVAVAPPAAVEPPPAVMAPPEVMPPPDVVLPPTPVPEPAALAESAAPPAVVQEPALMEDKGPGLSRVTIAGAFAALLSAEQAQPARPAARPATPGAPDAAVEEVVKRVLVRMTDQAVRQIVLETAERLIKEEIEKIRNFGP